MTKEEREDQQVLKKIPPFNTGKVLIGVYYERKPAYVVSRDMERLQAGLLNRRSEPSRQLMNFVEGLLVASGIRRLFP